MKKFFDKIKAKWRDNKAEFLLQICSLFLAITLLCIGFTTTLSAQVEPRAVNNVVSTGIYYVKAPTLYAGESYQISINFKTTYYDFTCSAIRVRYLNDLLYVDYFVTSSGVDGVADNSYITAVDAGANYLLFGAISVESLQSLSDNDYARFKDLYILTTPDLPDDPDDPDPPDDPDDPDQFIISKGSYIAGSGYTFPSQFLTAQINFTSYNRLTGETMRFSGLRIGVRNDISYIEYYDVADDDWLPVYVDGWQLDAYQSITVLDTATVTEAFYLKFNQIFDPASEYDAGFTAGYDEGFWDGKHEGYDEGYLQGYLQGSDDSGGDGFVGDMISSVFEGLDACEIYANYSILDLLKTIIGIFGAIWLLKLLAGG